MQTYAQVIVITATFLRMLFVYMGEGMAGFTSRSKRTRFIIRPLFGISFIMYGIVPLFASWDLRGTLVPQDWDNILTNGIYSDFNSSWFIDVGIIIKDTMIFNMFMPIIGFVGSWFIRYIWRSRDQGWKLYPGDYAKSRCNSVQEFVEIYSGDVFQIHVKYAYILTVCFIAFTYGMSMPVMFPIALVSLIIMYAVERTSMAYVYQKPPMYGEEINTLALRLLAVAPLFYILNTLWVLSNQQVFRGLNVENKTNKLFSIQDHHVSQFKDQLTPASVWLIFAPFILCYYIYSRSGFNLQRKICGLYSYRILDEPFVPF